MSFTTNNLFRFGSVMLALFVLASCKNENLIKRGDTLPVAYKKSMRLFKSEDYRDAANAFETVIELGRGTEYGKEAQYYLAESYFKDERYLMASAEYSRYETLYPQGKKQEEAQFKEAYSYYKLSPRYKLDQKYTKQAIEKLQLYISKYPNSEKRDKVAEYINEMRNKLAKKLYYAADLYLRTDRYKAASTYYDLAIDQYPETIWAQRALLGKINTYVIYADKSVRRKQRERYQKAIDAYETFVQLFPNGKYRSEAEGYVDEAREGIAELGDIKPDSSDSIDKPESEDTETLDQQAQ